MKDKKTLYIEAITSPHVLLYVLLTFVFAMASLQVQTGYTGTLIIVSFIFAILAVTEARNQKQKIRIEKIYNELKKYGRD